MQSRAQVVREGLPGQLDHVGDVDEFDAALVRGAQGVPAEPEVVVEAVEQTPAEVEKAAAVEQKPEAVERVGGGGRGNGSAAAKMLTGEAALPARRPSQPMGARVGAFLRASWAELQRVQWPDRPHVTQATAVVIGFVAVMGIYFGVADWMAEKIVNFIV